jgi:hypothetical protein
MLSLTVTPDKETGPCRHLGVFARDGRVVDCAETVRPDFRGLTAHAAYGPTILNSRVVLEDGEGVLVLKGEL